MKWFPIMKDEEEDKINSAYEEILKEENEKKKKEAEKLNENKEKE